MAVLAYLASRLTALPQIGDDVGNWSEQLGLVSITSEFLAATLAATALTTGRTRIPTADKSNLQISQVPG
ncbi:hypothetical protein DWB77_00342 [Streptomyces hundungensis]|uniref:Uncharacterized protein n=1 Tax=Streptomyces hundungensis TaxID=1077946 RepID=A0A387H3H2_9ACTN|nr:hypothetical protein DWB77_00342 [Streptomyces hundungensis]